MEIVAADIGGTNARFAIAEVSGGKVVHLAEPVTLESGDYVSLQTAWEAFGLVVGRPLPRAAAIAIAAPVDGEVIRMTNNPWTLRPASLAAQLGLEVLVIINDFAAVAHAVAHAGQQHFRHLSGPDEALPEAGVISVVGPGTGLGVAALLRAGGRSHVIATEGGHIDFAPLDSIEDRILQKLRERHTRVSVERIVAGPGLAAIYDVLAGMEGGCAWVGDNKALWAAAIAGSDSLAAAAFERFAMSFGAVAGDIALAHGAGGVVIAGGLGQRVADLLPRSGFAERFAAKGRYQARMATLPVKLITHPQPGLFGAAAAFAEEHS